ncbi:gamma-glutamylcyclotransferase family protein, partial [Streptomyces sparsus]
MNLPFFVYGTLRPGGRHHAWALHGRTRWQQPGRMHGLTLYEGPGYPYAVCSEGGGTVHGDLVLPAEQHYAEVLRVLDHLEGCTADEPTVGYRRTVAEAFLEDGTPVRARVYVAAAPLAARLLA